MKTNISLFLVWIVFGLMAGEPCWAEVKTYPVADFFKEDKFKEIKISPTGEYLAATVPRDGGTELVIFRMQDMRISARVKPAEKNHVANFFWANDHRVLFNMLWKAGSLADYAYNLQLFGINVDDKEPVFVAFGDMIDPLMHDDQHVLISPVRLRELLGHASGRDPPAKLIDVDTGKITGTKSAGPKPDCKLFYDHYGEPRFASCAKRGEITQSFYFRANDKARWELINSQAATGRQMFVGGFSADNQKAYLQIEEEKGPDGVYVFDMASRQLTLLMRDKSIDPESMLKSPVDGAVYAIRFNNGLPRTAFVDKADGFAMDLQKLLNTFPYDDVFPTSFSKDGRLGIYAVTSDTRPAEFYLFDRTSGKAKLLLTASDWFRNEDLAVMTPFKFKARDGLEINAFVTVPRGSSGKNLPMIINPHGGPFGIYDTWGFNPETQLLANRGYAVVQLNFRGSGNYGRDFVALGHRQWGRTMQDDITDATLWLIREGIADPDRICIYGASYGAYAALMGAAKEPGLYQCAIGNVGVYDLEKMYKDDGSKNSRLEDALDLILGKDGHREYSPNLLADKIEIPVLLAAGELDTIAPPEHTKMMQAALLKSGSPVEMVIYPNERHGNVIMANQLDFAERLLAFLDKHIGKRKTAGP